jgi:hypothetical protein
MQHTVLINQATVTHLFAKPTLHNMYLSIMITLSTALLALAQSNPPTSSSHAIASSAITYLDNSHHLPQENLHEYVERREFVWYDTNARDDPHWDPAASYHEETVEVVSCSETIWYRAEDFAALRVFEEETGPEPLAIEEH